MGITVDTYLCIVWFLGGLCLATPISDSEELDVKREESRIVHGHESIPGTSLLITRQVSYLKTNYVVGPKMILVCGCEDVVDKLMGFR